MPILDPDLVDELVDAGSFGTRTLSIFRRLVKGVRYLEVEAVAGAVSGQLKTGDGEDLEDDLPIVVRGYGAIPPAITVGTGSDIAGDGSDTVALTTNGSGAFTLIVVGAGTTVLEFSVPNGLTEVITTVLVP